MPGHGRLTIHNIGLHCGFAVFPRQETNDFNKRTFLLFVKDMIENCKDVRDIEG